AGPVQHVGPRWNSVPDITISREVHVTMSGAGNETAAGLDLSHDARQGVELIGMIGVQPETRTPGARAGVIGGSVDPHYLRQFARAHEESGFDTVLIGYASTDAGGLTGAGYA